MITAQELDQAIEALEETGVTPDSSPGIAWAIYSHESETARYSRSVIERAQEIRSAMEDLVPDWVRWGSVTDPQTREEERAAANGEPLLPTGARQMLGWLTTQALSFRALLRLRNASADYAGRPDQWLRKTVEDDLRYLAIAGLLNWFENEDGEPYFLCPARR